MVCSCLMLYRMGCTDTSSTVVGFPSILLFFSERGRAKEFSGCAGPGYRTPEESSLSRSSSSRRIRPSHLPQKK